MNVFALSSAEISLLPTLRSMGAGPVYPATVPAGAPAGSVGGASDLEEETKPVPPPVLCGAVSARSWRIWLSLVL